MTAGPEWVRQTLRRADQAWAAGRPRTVIALTSRALRDGGRDPRLLLLRARALVALGRFDLARGDLGRVVGDELCAAAALRLLCELALRRGDLKTAERFLAATLRLDSEHPRAVELKRVVAGWARAARRVAAARLRGADDADTPELPTLARAAA